MKKEGKLKKSGDGHLEIIRFLSHISTFSSSFALNFSITSG